ncbi:MAG: M23 family metallopeptidase [Bacteriovoracaceae bacterium]
MKKAFLLFFFSVQATMACDYLTQVGCNENERCIFLNDPTQPICFEKYLLPYPKISFPFSSSRIVTCDQGPHMPGEKKHSHAWLNAMNALDLRTKDLEDPGKIYAGLSGVAIIHSECREHNSKCGAGFGNQVKILNQKGYVLFYAHLEKVYVKNNEFVQEGQLIGLEGNTGWTGLNNRHLHMSVHYDWRKQGKDYWSKLGWLPRSIPFQFEVYNGSSTLNKILKSTTDTKCIRRVYNNFEVASLRGTILR